jgi:hypothetical protein
VSRAVSRQISFADFELMRQGMRLEPLLQAIADFLDDQQELIERVRRDLVRGLKKPGSGRRGFSSNVGGVNSRRSSSASSTPSGTGQVMPMTAARRRYSPTVDRLSPVVRAICRSLTPRACLNLRTSRTFRIGALSAGIGPPLAWPQRRRRPRFDRRHRELQAGLTSVAGFDRNGWPTSVGIGGRIASESVAALRRITHD